MPYNEEEKFIFPPTHIKFNLEGEAIETRKSLRPPYRKNG